MISNISGYMVGRDSLRPWKLWRGIWGCLETCRDCWAGRGGGGGQQVQALRARGSAVLCSSPQRLADPLIRGPSPRAAAAGGSRGRAGREAASEQTVRSKTGRRAPSFGTWLVNQLVVSSAWHLRPILKHRLCREQGG